MAITLITLIPNSFSRTLHHGVKVGKSNSELFKEDKGFFLQPLCPDQLWGPPSLLYNGYQASLPMGKARLGYGPDHSPPSSAKVKMSRRYKSSPP
jgi:hypothetical protein